MEPSSAAATGTDIVDDIVDDPNEIICVILALQGQMEAKNIDHSSFSLLSTRNR
jgi:hypothetical protein